MNTKRKSLIAMLLIAALAVVGLFVYRDALAKDIPQFRFATVQKGDIQSKVSATGTLNAVTTVSVGTQVSGQVAKLLVDYNAHVKKGELLARIDSTLARQSVLDAQATVDKARAQLLELSKEHSRNRDLLSAGLVAQSAYDQSQSTVAVAQAEVRSAEVAMQRAQQNLAYTSIYAPIDGVVVERNVQEGQTVAASLSAPQLFLIANDLTHMQILAQVGENDIAQIQEGQQVKFSVQALPSETFTGDVQQVRLQSTTTDNVVNYTVVVAVDNPNGKLLPGMTARVDFLTKSASNILEVSNAALRFRPTDEQLAALNAAKQAKPATTSANATTSVRAGKGKGGQRPANIGTLYTLDATGKLAAVRVRTGINDGSFTQIEGRNVTAGMNVIAGAATTSTSTSTSTQAAQQSNSSGPFGGSSSQRPQGGQRPGGF